MDPTSIYAGGALVTLFTWTFISLMMFFDNNIDWCSEDWKVFVIGLICCFMWPATLPIATYFFYQKRKG